MIHTHYILYRREKTVGVCRNCSSEEISSQQPPFHNVLSRGTASYTHRVPHVAHQSKEAWVSLHLWCAWDGKDSLSLAHSEKLV